MKQSAQKNKGILVKGLNPQASHCQLHDKLKEYLGYCLYKAAGQIKSMVDEQFAPFGLVSPQFGMLVRLEFQGAKTQGELCQDMAMDKATMVRMIDGLEDKKYLARVRSQQDRRANRLEITKAGRQAILKMNVVRKVAEEQFLTPLTPAERKQLLNLVVKLISARQEA